MNRRRADHSGAVRSGSDAESRRRGRLSAALSLVLIGCVVGGVAVLALDGGAGTVALLPFLTSTPSPAPDAPTACFAFNGHDFGTAPGGEAIARAATSAALPPSLVLSPGLQVLASTTVPGSFELIARVCGGSLSRSQLIAAGTAIAAAIYADPSHDRLSVLVVSPWTPSGDSGIVADPVGIAISTDYQAHRWDRPPRELRSAWGSS